MSANTLKKLLLLLFFNAHRHKAYDYFFVHIRYNKKYVFTHRELQSRYNYYHIQKVLRAFSIVPLSPPPPPFSYFPSFVPNKFYLGITIFL